MPLPEALPALEPTHAEVAVRILERILPFKRGSATFNQVCNGYSRGFGTTCAFLPHFVLWKSGVSGNNWSSNWANTRRSLLNIDDTSLGTTFTTGEGITRIFRSPAFVNLSTNPVVISSSPPDTGDVVYVNKPEVGSGAEHVFMIAGVEGNTWRTGEAGAAAPNAADGTDEAHFGTRRVIRVTDAKGVQQWAVSDKFFGGFRYLVGWLDMSQLDFT